MDIITIQLTVEEINGVLQTLGQLPTSSGAWPLLMKIKVKAKAKARRTQAGGARR